MEQTNNDKQQKKEKKRKITNSHLLDAVTIKTEYKEVEKKVLKKVDVAIILHIFVSTKPLSIIET